MELVVSKGLVVAVILLIHPCWWPVASVNCSHTFLCHFYNITIFFVLFQKLFGKGLQPKKGPHKICLPILTPSGLPAEGDSYEARTMGNCLSSDHPRPGQPAPQVGVSAKTQALSMMLESVET